MVTKKKTSVVEALSKKILWITDSSPVEPLASICKISEDRFNLVFDHTSLAAEGEKWDSAVARARAMVLLRDTPHVMLVLVGQQVAHAFNCGPEDKFIAFPLVYQQGEERVVRAGLKVPPRNHKFYRNPQNLLLAMTALGDLVTMSGLQVTDKDVKQCLATVEALGEDTTFWTKKIYNEIKAKFEGGGLIEKWDLVQLFQSYANDVSFIKDHE